MQIESIKNIIFDLGNVIINIDPELSVKSMSQLGFRDFDQSYSLLNQSNLFDSLEKGLISPEVFHSEINSQLELKVNCESIDKAWGAMLLDFPKARIELLQKLSQKYRLFLLSNTNIIHYHKYNNDLISQFGFNLNSLFEKAYYSFEIGMRKPEVEIFEHVLNDSDLNPFETVFVDDLPKNIDVAGRMGFNTVWIDVKKGDDITEKLNDF
ncbi:MAG: HAD family phosphatase [Bacteroidales bacterium]|nr:HAD family phosphatase [Bacteroidales bacterium]